MKHVCFKLTPQLVSMLFFLFGLVGPPLNMATEAAGSSKDNINQGHGTTENRADTPIQKGPASSEITEEFPREQHGTRQNLILDIPAISQEEARKDYARINMPLTSPPRRLIFPPGLSPVFPRSKKYPVLLVTPRGKKTSSLPVTAIAYSNPGSVHGGNLAFAETAKKELNFPIRRSRSAPMLNKEGNSPVRGMFRIVPTTLRLDEKIATTPPMTSPIHDTVKNEDVGEDIPEEEAVCRICMVELGEGGNTFKLECGCKGDLSLAHRGCAVKWFTIKGNRTCDVCKQEVQNLTVTLLRVQNGLAQNGLAQNGLAHNMLGADASRYRFWPDFAILVVINMLAYFWFHVSNMGSGTIVHCLAFSCVLGSLASFTATVMDNSVYLNSSFVILQYITNSSKIFLVRRNHVWIYATVQFCLVFLIEHLFFSLACRAMLSEQNADHFATLPSVLIIEH
ncbi:hypothetical protein GmHk_10G027841 [Glycine max]|nr:hypothetical protein GmHk_10G027841 [Glycine max]